MDILLRVSHVALVAVHEPDTQVRRRTVWVRIPVHPQNEQSRRSPTMVCPEGAS